MVDHSAKQKETFSDLYKNAVSLGVKTQSARIAFVRSQNKAFNRIPNTTIRNWARQMDGGDFFVPSKKTQKRKGKKEGKGKGRQYIPIENALVRRLDAYAQMGARISNAAIQWTALKIRNEEFRIAFPNFVASLQWVRDFKNNHHFTCIDESPKDKKLHETPIFVPTIQRFFDFNGRLAFKYRFDLNRIYNIDYFSCKMSINPGRCFTRAGVPVIKPVDRDFGSEAFSVLVTTCADGGNWVKLVIIFQRPLGFTAAEEAAEQARCPSNIYLIFNETGYATREVTVEWLEKVFSMRTHPPDISRPSDNFILLLMDSFSAHLGSDNSLTQAMEAHKCIRSVIPGGFTGYLQPCDLVAILPLRISYKKLENDWYIRNISHYYNPIYTPTHRRTDIIQFMSRAAFAVYPTIIQKTIDCFKSIGASVNADGSEDHLLSVRGLEQQLVVDRSWPNEIPLRPGGSERYESPFIKHDSPNEINQTPAQYFNNRQTIGVQDVSGMWQGIEVVDLTNVFFDNEATNYIDLSLVKPNNKDISNAGEGSSRDMPIELDSESDGYGSEAPLEVAESLETEVDDIVDVGFGAGKGKAKAL
ncbi:hypothetical protein BofuT4_P038030.1 [Botrytis cinerea T4]|uniref:DDE-1 domain-containing protein n=1 Tax=Botryotinia fuckeliana (strain T4) TaxID=999810 RepID=G2Y583_BOTF4|nr:hypothetical protein BofuT4_P038030.1 [Botrytis cinerea T4]